MMGVYGMLAVGLALFACATSSRPTGGRTGWPRSPSGRSTSAWPGCASPPCCRWASLQLYHSVNNGYFEARSLGYITNPTNACWSGCGCPATWCSSSAGCVPFLWIAWLGVRHSAAATVTTEEPEDVLFTEISRTGAEVAER